jgi:hypothetical protein
MNRQLRPRRAGQSLSRCVVVIVVIVMIVIIVLARRKLSFAYVGGANAIRSYMLPPPWSSLSCPCVVLSPATKKNGPHSNICINPPHRRQWFFLLRLSMFMRCTAGKEVRIRGW